jgi:asparagine synthase (glutamine-hydrolysing)
MCAIAGILTGALEGNQSALGRMLATMEHRGPDDTGSFVDQQAGIGLGHNRLSIIDLSSSGHQPMVNPRTGDVLVFNGEIFNFREVRNALEGEGMHFASHSDTEVLLLAWERWGVGCLTRLRGMYAFALWEPGERQFYLARDPLGIKPLYYWPRPAGGGLVFASEIKAFLAIPGFRPALDRRAVSQFLEFGYTFEEHRTILNGVLKLPPGHFLKLVPGGRPLLKRHFDPQIVSDRRVSASTLEEELFATLDDVVGQHLIADVPVGLLLSGGLDSSLIAALAARHTAVRTFTMGFSQSSLDERAYGARVARHIGAQHEDILVAPEEISRGLESTVACFDDLFADWGTISTRLLYRKCRERGVKVVLVGEGSDELFGGYDVFRMSYQDSPIEWWLFQLYRRYCGRRYGGNYRPFRAIMRRYLDAAGGDRFDAIRLFESRHQLPNNYVMKVDKASMSVSVEARVPYLDQRVAEIGYRMPREYLLDLKSEKVLLRNVARRFGLLPEETLRRPKMGGSMAAAWMDEQQGFRSFARNIILARGGWTEALGLRPAMEAYFTKNRLGYSFPRAISLFRNLAWRLLILELWSSTHRLAPDAS